MKRKLEKAFNKMLHSHEKMAYVENHYKSKRDADYLICVNPDWEEEYEIVEKALKRNEPMKVNHKENKGVTTVGTCGNCGGLVNEVNDNYCSLCGQKIDWESA